MCAEAADRAHQDTAFQMENMEETSTTTSVLPVIDRCVTVFGLIRNNLPMRLKPALHEAIYRGIRLSDAVYEVRLAECALATNARTFSASLRPGVTSTPEATSTPHGRSFVIA